MGINVAWIDERRLPLKEVFDPGAVISRIATTRWLAFSDSKCLQFIEPWGDTTFNQTQIPVLLTELKAELHHMADLRDTAHLKEVINLVEMATNQVHTYVVFIGD